MTKRQIKRDRGVSLLGYGLLIGLIGVVALSAIGGTGSSVNVLFGDVADSLTDAGASQGATGAMATPTATPTPSNQPPEFASSVGGYAGTQGQSFGPVTISGFADPDGDTLSFSQIGSWPAGVSLTKLNDGEVELAGTPSANGSFASLSIRASDGNGGQVDTPAFTITIAAPDPCASSPSIGTVCSDGSVYAGLSPDGNVPMFATRCDLGQSHNGSSCTGTRNKQPWNDGSTNWLDTSLTNCPNRSDSTPQCVDGDGLTATLLSIDSSSASGTQPHLAAQACASLVLHGHSDWYLPSIGELYDRLYANRFTIGGFDTSTSGAGSRYWTSSEWNDYIGYHPNFNNGDTLTTTVPKDHSINIRCVRK